MSPHRTKELTTLTIAKETKQALEELRSNYTDEPDASWDMFLIDVCNYIKEHLEDTG